MARLRSRAPALMVLSMMATVLPASAVASGTPDVSTRSARLAPHIAPGLVALGRLADTQPLRLDVVLAPSHPRELQALLAAQRDPSSSQYGRYLAPGQFVQMFGPDAHQVDAVTTWLHRQGLVDTKVNGFAVEVRASSGATAHALGITMERFRTPDDGETFSAREAPLVPGSLSPGISAILGLSDSVAAVPKLDRTPRAAPHPSARAIPHADGLTPCTAATNAAGGNFWTPDQVGALYGVGPLLTAGQTGSGKKIALVELAAHTAADTSGYLTCFGLHNTVTTVKIDGGAPTNSPNGTLEANIDIEEAATQSTHAAIVSYEGPNSGLGEFDVYQHIADDDTAQAVSTSWGLCEPDTNASFMNAISTELAQSAAQGQTVVAASGDSGSEDCFAGGAGPQTLAVDSPANDPNITGVGGTFLFGAGDEPVWNNCQGEPDFATCDSDSSGNEGAGGGGLSAFFARPAWQPAVAQGTCSLASCRQVPDVSANAGVGEVFKSANVWIPVGGTSIAAPKIAAMVADVDTACTASVGDLAPKLTTLAAGNGYGTALNDVTNGDNDLTLNQGGDFTAVVGTDLATGVGTPIASGWSCPQITSLSTTQAAAGTDVTITGFGLANATITFGNTTAAITAGPTATSVTVTIPAGAGTVAVHGTNAIGSGTHAVNFSYPGVVTTTTTTTVPKPPPPPPPPKPVNTRAYLTVASDGGIFTFGGAAFHGSTGATRLNQPIVGMTTDATTGGYWFVARDGGIFGFDAPFFGSAGGTPLAAPVVGMAGTADGKGYWLITANGTVLAYGDAHNYGSVTRASAPIVGMASTPDGNGYWLAGSDGGIYPFGDAGNFGGMSGVKLTRPIVGIAVDAATGGYWMVATDGGIFGFNAPFFGSTGAIRLNQPIVGISATANGKGYWMVARDGGIFTFGGAQFTGSMGGTTLNQPMVGMAAAR
jgi:subtilase family serine protease